MSHLAPPKFEPKTKEAKLAKSIYDELTKLADTLPQNEKMAVRLQLVAFPTMVKGLDEDAGFRAFFNQLAGVLRVKLEDYYADSD